MNKVTLERMYLSKFILINYPNSEGNYTVTFGAKSKPAGHCRFVISLTAYKCNWERFVPESNFIFLICIFAINAIYFKHKFTKLIAILVKGC